MNTLFPLTKRHKQESTPSWFADNHVTQQQPLQEPTSDFDGLFSLFLFPLDEAECYQSSPVSGTIAPQDNDRESDRPKKRAFNSLDSGPLNASDQEEWSLSPLIEGQDVVIASRFPDTYPSPPLIADRVVNLKLCNPFIEDTFRHPSLRTKATLAEDVEVNGYIKCRIISPHATKSRKPASSAFVVGQKSLVVRNKGFVQTKPLPGNNIPNLPPGFGSNLRLHPCDRGLWKFYKTAFCVGRTLLDGTNLWLIDFASMAESNECVRHALFALTATYVLDFTPSPGWQTRANMHYKQATLLLSQALQNPESQDVGKEDAIVGSLILLTCEDIITWEMRRPKGKVQRWVEGVQTAIEILDKSDPGYRYWKLENVQSSATRISNANLIASFEIVAHPVNPLHTKGSGSKYAWLLEGSERDTRKIHGGTGVSPKLLHMFSQITLFAAEMDEKPNCRITPKAAASVGRRLTDFRQWSDLSEGYPSAKALLDSCDLDSNGQVATAAEVTDLTGQAWVSAAQIYLQCRVYRRPRSHPTVRKHLDMLLRCVERMPCTGKLFTSQSPFFPIFIMGVVSYREEDRKVAYDWFDTVVGGAGNRSSVPPVWTALKDLWTWIDVELDEDSIDFHGPIEHRKPWWEQMVERLMSTCGPLSLC